MASTPTRAYVVTPTAENLSANLAEARALNRVRPRTGPLQRSRRLTFDEPRAPIELGGSPTPLPPLTPWQPPLVLPPLPAEEGGQYTPAEWAAVCRVLDTLWDATNIGGGAEIRRESI